MASNKSKYVHLFNYNAIYEVNFMDLSYCAQFISNKTIFVFKVIYAIEKLIKKIEIFRASMTHIFTYLYIYDLLREFFEGRSKKTRRGSLFDPLKIHVHRN